MTKFAWMSGLIAMVCFAGCVPATPPRTPSVVPSVNVTDLKPKALSILSTSLTHESGYVRDNAIEVAVETDRKELMPEIVRRMTDEAIAVRFSATVAAGDMLCYGCEQGIREQLKDADENVRLAAAYSLVKLNYQDYHDAVRQGVKSDDQTVRANAVLLLGKIGDREDMALLYQAMRDNSSDDKVKIQAIDSLARLKDIRLYRSKLWALLISKYADDRVMGIRGMGALGTPEAKNAILTTLSDDILEVRLCAAEQLGRLGDKTGKDEVLTYLQANPELNQPDVATMLAVMAIGRIGSPELTGYLPKALESTSEVIRLTAAEAVLLLAK